MSLHFCVFKGFLNLFFNWRNIALERCISFCCTTVRISHNYACSLSLEPPSLSPPHPSRSSQSWAELPVLYYRLPQVTCFTHETVYMSIPLSLFIPPSPSPTVSTNSCSTSASPFLKKLGINLPYHPAVPLLGIYPGSLRSEDFDANLRVW